VLPEQLCGLRLRRAPAHRGEHDAHRLAVMWHHHQAPGRDVVVDNRTGHHCEAKTRVQAGQQSPLVHLHPGGAVDL